MLANKLAFILLLCISHSFATELELPTEGDFNPNKIIHELRTSGLATRFLEVYGTHTVSTSAQNVRDRFSFAIDILADHIKSQIDRSVTVSQHAQVQCKQDTAVKTTELDSVQLQVSACTANLAKVNEQIQGLDQRYSSLTAQLDEKKAQFQSATTVKAQLSVSIEEGVRVDEQAKKVMAAFLVMMNLMEPAVRAASNNASKTVSTETSTLFNLLRDSILKASQETPASVTVSLNTSRTILELTTAEITRLQTEISALEKQRADLAGPSAEAIKQESDLQLQASTLTNKLDELTKLIRLTEQGCLAAQTSQQNSIDDLEAQLRILEQIKKAYLDLTPGARKKVTKASFELSAKASLWVAGYHYVYSPWSKCSVTCGVGVETRKVYCVDIEKNPAASMVFCEGTEPVKVRPCAAPACA